MQGKCKEAEQEYRKIIEVEGVHRNGYYCNVGVAILMQDDPSRYPEAIEYLRKAVALPRFDPQDENAYYEACNQLANALGMSGDRKGEEEVLERIIRENGPFKAEARGRLAEL
jgi:tetratricopeptide (TPR) repeat protein